jgi:predicted transcriptional regulator
MVKSRAANEAARLKDVLPPFDDDCPGCGERAQKIQKLTYSVEDAIFNQEEANKILEIVTHRLEKTEELASQQALNIQDIAKRTAVLEKSTNTLVNIGIADQLREIKGKALKVEKSVREDMIPALLLVAKYKSVKKYVAYAITIISTLSTILINIPASWWERLFR